MRIDLNHFSVHRKPVQDWYRNNTHIEMKDAVSMWAYGTQCPCICIAFYLCEEFGYTEEMVKKINTLIKFYDYRQILGQKEGSPFLTEDGKILGSFE
jgi:hypothetical protein